jgi:hypothetical protein
MKAIIDAAARRGLKEMEGFVLRRNHSMLRLARRLGFASSRSRRRVGQDLPAGARSALSGRRRLTPRRPTAAACCRLVALDRPSGR